jgi:penicillin V acylase-like amidase (Ntn superfamily)
MKRCLLFAIAGFCCVVNAFACTTFFLNKNGQLVFGRNYDWVTETGTVNINLRGSLKTSLDEGKTFQWVAKYGSIAFNQYGKEFPTGGMNEKGLVVELMWLSESKFPDPDHRPALNVLQWIQYQLDNCSTIDDVIATDASIRINPQSPPQHYLVADAAGNAATIEFLNGKMVVHKGSALPVAVLANSPYESSIKAVKEAAETKASSSFNDNSLQRFGTACAMVKKFYREEIQKPVVDYAFDVLSAVAQEGFTKWSIVYDISNRRIHFKTAVFQDIKIIEMDAFDLVCPAKPKAFSMNQAAKGNVSSKFVDFSAAVNASRLKEAFAQSKPEINIDEKVQNAAAHIAEKTACRQ